jgi:guanosine-3',5'-bis(diphosphate) 3'-pyrophosphohydrolase
MNLKHTYILVMDAHVDQLDKSGVPYYHHPFAVAGIVAGMTDDPDAVFVALLHDVIEDTAFTAQILLDLGYSPRIVEAVELVTRTPDMTYFQFIYRIASSQNKVAIAVKIADITHNLSRITPELKGLEKRYTKALSILTPQYTELTND